MDPDGNEPIDGALASAAAPGTLIEFPAGRYLLEADHRITGLRNFGIRGLGDRQRDVEFVTPDGHRRQYLDIVDGQNVVVENVAFQVSRGVAKAPELGSAEAEDTIEEKTVSGSVAGDVDAYRFSGTIRRLRMDGFARICFGAEN